MVKKYLDYRAGIGNVGSYQASAKPYISSSIIIPADTTPVEVKFPNITRFLTVKNDSVDTSNIRVGFSYNGVMESPSANFFILEDGENYSGDWRVRSVWIRRDGGSSVTASATVIAGLTGIDYKELNHNWSGSDGVG